MQEDSRVRCRDPLPPNKSRKSHSRSGSESSRRMTEGRDFHEQRIRNKEHSHHGSSRHGESRSNNYRRSLNEQETKPRNYNGRSDPHENSKEPRGKRSRWGGRGDLPLQIATILPSVLPTEQMDSYIVLMRIEEINRKLRMGYCIPECKERSPSPEPIYDADGKRINTREYRYKKKLETERHKLVDLAIRKIPNFKPPPDYKKPTKISDKMYIPVKDYPEINFIGQLIGPRGTTLKRIEGESGAKISIRGKGSVKEGKSRADGALAPGEEEDLHCLVTADSEEKVAMAMKAIEKVIETAASVPEGQNELKRMQLRYLAELNGTLRDDENQICSNCGVAGHRRSDCPEQRNVTVNLVCKICDSLGHATRDCMQKNSSEFTKEVAQRDRRLDSEYANLMAELGEIGYDPTDTTHNKTSNVQPPRGKRPPWATNSDAQYDQDKLANSGWLQMMDPAQCYGQMMYAQGQQYWMSQDAAPPGYSTTQDMMAYNPAMYPPGQSANYTTSNAYFPQMWGIAQPQEPPQQYPMGYNQAQSPTWVPPPPDLVTQMPESQAVAPQVPEN